MKNIAIITARGGSKRIPKKNIKEFCGKPIISYSIEAALKCGIFDEVMVSTDSETIANIAKRYGAKVPFLRSESTANDFATTKEVIHEVLEEYEKQNKVFETFCCIYPTAPFVTSSKLLDAYNYLNSDYEGVIPVVKYSFPPQRAFEINDEILKYQNPKYEMVRSQDLKSLYHDAGQFYFLKCDAFKKQDTMVLRKTKGLVMDELEVQDIDNETDWKLAELKYKIMSNREG